MESLLETLKALSDKTRLRILLLLPGHELCLGQIMATLELSPSTVSKHVSVLKSTGLVTDRKSGKWVYCSLSGNPEGTPQELFSLIAREISKSPEVIEDRRKLQKILEIPPETLCERFRTRNRIGRTII
jgi:DNA-binding transcriptional ArsR family regulator